jgi:hypothetical protein
VNISTKRPPTIDWRTHPRFLKAVVYPFSLGFGVLALEYRPFVYLNFSTCLSSSSGSPTELSMNLIGHNCSDVTGVDCFEWFTWRKGPFVVEEASLSTFLDIGNVCSFPNVLYHGKCFDTKQWDGSGI